jgi:hypothetical protein
MVRFYALLAVATAFIASSSGSAVFEARDTLPPLTPAGIINALESIGFIENITAFITVSIALTSIIPTSAHSICRLKHF